MPQMPQMNMNMANTAVGAGSRRGSGIAGMNPMQMQSVQTLAGYGSSSQRCSPPMQQIKSNSLSLPDSPTVVGNQRGRSNSLRVGYYSYYTHLPNDKQEHLTLTPAHPHSSNTHLDTHLFCLYVCLIFKIYSRSSRWLI